MKSLNLLLAGAVFALLTACGGSSGDTAGAASTTCPAGQSSTVQGCVASTQTCQLNGTSTQGIWYNNQCIQTSNTTGTTCTVAGQVSTTAGCVPQGQSCNVQGTNAQGTYYNGQCVQLTNNGYNNGSSCVNGQVQTTAGCVASTQTCYVPGTNAQGVYYNNQCVQIVQNYNQGGYQGGYNQGGYNQGYNQGGCVNVSIPGVGNQCLTPCSTPGTVMYNGMCYNLIPLNNGNYNGSSYYYYSNGRRSYNYGYTGGFSMHFGAGF